MESRRRLVARFDNQSLVDSHEEEEIRMYAYYQFVSNSEEKQIRLDQIRKLTFADPDYYSPYLKAHQSMMRR